MIALYGLFLTFDTFIYWSNAHYTSKKKVKKKYSTTLTNQKKNRVLPTLNSTSSYNSTLLEHHQENEDMNY